MNLLLKVFVVEDNDEHYGMLKRVLESLPAVSVTGRACDADEAIREIGKHHPDLAIVDLNLARSSGIDVLKTLRNGRLPPKLLAMSDSDSCEAAVAAGANWFYPKGSGLSDLINRIAWLTVELFDHGPDWHKTQLQRPRSALLPSTSGGGIARAHGGDIGVRSDEDETAFAVPLPRRAPARIHQTSNELPVERRIADRRIQRK